MTLTNGRGGVGFDYPAGGGGLLTAGPNSDPTIVRCVIRNNEYADTRVGGGGIGCTNGTIEDCTFLDNVSAFGGAVYSFGTRILRCTFLRNRAVDDGTGLRGIGGAVRAIGGVIEDCMFEANTTTSAFQSGGGAVYATGATVRNSVFIGNAALGSGFNRGGAIGAENGSLVEYCTIVGSSGGSTNGIAGIWTQNWQTTRLRNVIIAHSTLGKACGGDLVLWTCSAFYGNPTPDPICTTGGFNFRLDPQFCDEDPITSRNVSLQADSPCAPGNHPDGTNCGQIGARPVGCGTIGIESSTWSGFKQRYR